MSLDPEGLIEQQDLPSGLEARSFAFTLDTSDLMLQPESEVEIAWALNTLYG